MYELIQAAENSYYMDCPAKVGFVKTGEDEVVIIDSGSDKDAGKKVRKILTAQNWKLKAIFNTHSHADHIGGNRYLQEQTGCRIYAPEMERCHVEYPILEPTILYGGYAMKDLHNKFLKAQESAAENLVQDALPDGMEIISLPGHSYNMVGFRTADDVVYLADSLCSEDTIRKYRIGFLYDVRAYLETLEKIKTIEAACFIPSHAPAADDIVQLAQLNIDTTKEIIDDIIKMLSIPKTIEDLMSGIFSAYGLSMNLQQNVLIGSTIRSYLSYLKDEGLADFYFENNRMLWISR